LVVTVNHGMVSTNVSEPYMVAMPQEFLQSSKFKATDDAGKQVKNLVVIDTKNEVTIERFKAYDTMFWITKDSIVGYSNNSSFNYGPNSNTYVAYNAAGISIQPFDRNLTVVINKANVEHFMNKAGSWLKFAYPIAFIGSCIGMFLLLLIAGMIYLFLGALCIWLVAKVKHVSLGYWKAYQLGFHLLTAVFLVDILVAVLHIGAFPFFGTIILILFAVLNLKKKQEIITLPQS